MTVSLESSWILSFPECGSHLQAAQLGFQSGWLQVTCAESCMCRRNDDLQQGGSEDCREKENERSNLISSRLRDLQKDGLTINRNFMTKGRLTNVTGGFLFQLLDVHLLWVKRALNGMFTEIPSLWHHITSTFPLLVNCKMQSFCFQQLFGNHNFKVTRVRSCYLWLMLPKLFLVLCNFFLFVY